MDLPESLRERYQTDRALGAGGFGTVLRCRDLQLDRPVAVKLLARDVDDEEWRRRFDREARVTAGLQHPGIVRVYDHGVTPEGQAFIVYELVDGPDLAEHVHTTGPPDPETACAWAEQLADALAAVHAAGLVHRDVKPENVLRREDGSLVLTDFGIVRAPGAQTAQTAEGLILGTPPYLAPEIWQGSPHEAAGDQFAWAATMVRLLTGRGVYPGEEPGEVIRSLNEWSPEESLNAVPDALRPALRRALSPDPRARFPDMTAAREALLRRPARPEAETVVVETRPPIRAAAPGPNSRLPLGLAALLLAGVLVGWFFSPGPTPPPPVDPDPPDHRALAAPLLEAREDLVRTLGLELPVDGDWPRSWSHSTLEMIQITAHPRTVRLWRTFFERLGRLLRHLEARGGVDLAVPSLPWLIDHGSLPSFLSAGLHGHIRMLNRHAGDYPQPSEQARNELEDQLVACEKNIQAIRAAAVEEVSRLRHSHPEPSASYRFLTSRLEVSATATFPNRSHAARLDELPYPDPISLGTSTDHAVQILNTATEKRLISLLACEDARETFAAGGRAWARFEGSPDGQANISIHLLRHSLNPPPDCPELPSEVGPARWVELVERDLARLGDRARGLSGLLEGCARDAKGDPALKARIVELVRRYIEPPEDDLEANLRRFLRAEAAVRLHLTGNHEERRWELDRTLGAAEFTRHIGTAIARRVTLEFFDALVPALRLLEELPEAERRDRAPWLYRTTQLHQFCQKLFTAFVVGSSDRFAQLIDSSRLRLQELQRELFSAGANLDGVFQHVRARIAHLRLALPTPSPAAHGLLLGLSMRVQHGNPGKRFRRWARSLPLGVGSPEDLDLRLLKLLHVAVRDPLRREPLPCEAYPEILRASERVLGAVAMTSNWRLVLQMEKARTALRYRRYCPQASGRGPKRALGRTLDKIEKNLAGQETRPRPHLHVAWQDAVIQGEKIGDAPLLTRLRSISRRLKGP